MTDEDYQTLIDERISDLAALHAHGHPIDASMCVVGISERKLSISKLRDYCVNKLKIKAKDFDRSLNQHIVEAKLGGMYPETAADLIHFYVQDKNITAQYNGLLTKQERPFIEVDGEREYFEPEDRPDLARTWSAHTFGGRLISPTCNATFASWWRTWDCTSRTR